MAKGSDVLSMLIPNGGWIMTGNNYEGIQFLECEPITKKQFTDGFKLYDSWKANQDSAKALAKSELLKRLGMTLDEVTLLLN